MIITIAHQRQIADYLMSNCGDADQYRAEFAAGKDFGAIDVDPIHRVAIIERWGCHYKDLIEDIAYNDALLQPWALAFDAEEPARFRAILATAFLSAIWPDIEGWFGEAILQHHADEEAERKFEEYKERTA